MIFAIFAALAGASLATPPPDPGTFSTMSTKFGPATQSTLKAGCKMAFTIALLDPENTPTRSLTSLAGQLGVGHTNKDGYIYWASAEIVKYTPDGRSGLLNKPITVTSLAYADPAKPADPLQPARSLPQADGSFFAIYSFGDHPSFGLSKMIEEGYVELIFGRADRPLPVRAKVNFLEGDKDERGPDRTRAAFVDCAKGVLGLP